MQPVKDKLTFAHLRAGAVLASLPRLALLAFWSRPSRPKIWQFVFFLLKILDFADVYLQRHSPGALHVPWLGRQPSAQTGEEQKIPFHPSWKKEQNQHFNIILWTFQPCRCTGTVVDRCHGHNQAAEHNPDSKVLSQIITMISSISAVYYITYYIIYSIYDIYHTILYDI